MNPRSTIGPIAGVLAATVLALAPGARAREAAKFKVLSIAGTETSSRDVVYAPSIYGSCAWSQVERIRFHSTKPVTAYAFTSKAHGRARVEWASKPNFTGNLTQVAVPGEVTVSRSATYQQANYMDPDTGEILPGCFNEPSPVDCTVERTLPLTLNIGGTSDSDESTYVQLEFRPGDLNAIDAACLGGLLTGAEDPRLFSRADLFNGKKKRLSDTDRVDEAFDTSSETESNTATSSRELAGELKRKKPRR
jgi:hypothetical protein